jgi:beta-glucosidase
MTAKNTLIISVVGESPYAEMVGDVNIPYCQNQSVFSGDGCIWWPSTYSPDNQPKSLEVPFNEFEKNVINHIRDQDKNIPLLTVLISGRPMIINDILNESNAFISAFLPGTSGGQGIVNSIFGNYVFRANGANDQANTLSFDWPKTMEQLKDFPYYGTDGELPRISDPAFKVGYGLSSVRMSEE